MKPSAPSKSIWALAMIIGGLGLLSLFTPIPFVSAYSYWFFMAGFSLLALGTTFKGL